MDINQNPGNVYNATQIPAPEKPKTGLAIASLVLGIVSIVGFGCCFINILTAPLAIIFGIISLVTHRASTGMSIAGIITAALSLVITIAIIASNWILFANITQISEDYVELVENADEVFPAYEEDGTLPDYLEKYTEGDYEEYWDKMDMTFYDIMDILLEQYKQGTFDNVTVTTNTAVTEWLTMA